MFEKELSWSYPKVNDELKPAAWRSLWLWLEGTEDDIEIGGMEGIVDGRDEARMKKFPQDDCKQKSRHNTSLPHVRNFSYTKVKYVSNLLSRMEMAAETPTFLWGPWK
jgi:hypothetical protein